MKFFTYFIALCSLHIFVLCNRASAQTVHFGLPDYAEFGYIRDAVKPGYEEMSNNSLSLSASLKYSDLLTQSISGAFDLVPNSSSLSNYISNALSFYGAAKTINDAMSASDVNGILSSFSLIDLSSTRASLSSLDASLNTLSSQVVNPILPPTLYTYYAIAVSERAKNQAVALKKDATSGLESLQRSSSNVNTYKDTFATYSDNLIRASNITRDLYDLVFKIAEIPGFTLTSEPYLINLLATKGDIDNLFGDVGKVQSHLVSASTNVDQRISESKDLINALDAALQAPGLSSNWTTWAEFSSRSSLYELFFDGRSFYSPYTEIDGEFLLGTLTAYNYRTPGGGGARTSASIDFNVFRQVNDPILGLQETNGVARVDMNYFATPNSDDVLASRDYFNIPSLGIDILIPEESYASFNVKGRYDSPLRISSIEAVPGGGGTVRQAIPEPITAVLMVFGGFAMLNQRRNRLIIH